MSDKIETVKVEANTKSGFKIINKADIGKDDKIFVASPPKQRKKRNTK